MPPLSPPADVAAPSPAPPQGIGERGEAAHVTAVIVTYNRVDKLLSVVGDVAGQNADAAIDLVIVDNASTDGTSERALRAFNPECVVRAGGRTDAELPGRNTLGLRSVTLIRHEQNLGGTGGFNAGMRFADRHLVDGPGEHLLWLIDDDVELPRDALSSLIRTVRSHDSIGIAGSRTVDLNDRRTTIESTIYFDPERSMMGDAPAPDHPAAPAHAGFVRRFGGTRGDAAFTGVMEVDVVPACSLLARWEAVRRVGVWDDRFFLYCDDAEWCLRMARAGWRVVCDMDAVVYHTPWFSKLTPEREYYAHRNVIWLIRSAVRDARRRRRAVGRWYARLLRDALRALLARDLRRAELLRCTAHDAARGRGGPLVWSPPPARPRPNVVKAVRAVAFSCRFAGTCAVCLWSLARSGPPARVGSPADAPVARTP